MKTSNSTLENRVSVLETDVSILKGQVGTLTSEQDFLAARVSTLESFNLPALESSVADLTTRVVKLEAGGVVLPPPDQNVYPLKMPPNIPPGGTVDIGVGPDILTMLLSSQPDLTFPECSIALGVDGKVIAGPLQITARTGMAGGQRFNIHGSWGSRPKTVQFYSGGELGGLNLLWLNEASYDFIPLVYNGPSLDARGAIPAPNSTGVWDNIGAPFEMSTETVVVIPPPPPTEPSIIKDGKTLQQLVDSAVAGSIITLPEGSFNGTAKVDRPITIEGAGIGKTILSCAGMEPAASKGLFAAYANLTLRNMSLTGAAVADRNGAAVRNEPGIALTLDNLEIYGCENGILTSTDGGPVTITGCQFHDNGAANGLTHEIYIGHTAARVSITTTTSTCGTKSTHSLKSRAAITVVSNSNFNGSPDMTGNVGGSVVDLPDGGSATFTDVTITLQQGAGNTLYVGYALESQNNGLSGVSLTRVLFVGPPGKVQSGAPALLSRSGVVGDQVTYVGWL